MRCSSCRPTSAPGALFVSSANFPNVPAFGGTFVSFGGFGFSVALVATGAGTVSVPLMGVSSAADLVLQSVFIDPSLPQGVAFSNAILAQFGP